MDVSIVIRTLNEAEHLPALLAGIAQQSYAGGAIETVLVDSGSTDGTLEIAERFGAHIIHIKREDFSFGRSLNMGCDAATGDALVFVSGHCIPLDPFWIANLVGPLGAGIAAYSYGRQVGGETTKFSESRIFAKYFPKESKIPQQGFFCNNANAAILKRDWEKFRFDEQLTGLEDMHLAKQLVGAGRAVAYIAEAPVNHLHNESWPQVKRRFEREAIALQQIMPEVHVSFVDFLRYTAAAILLDFGAALEARRLRKVAMDIMRYRTMQFWGSYRGSHITRQLSRKARENYFYPS